MGPGGLVLHLQILFSNPYPVQKEFNCFTLTNSIAYGMGSTQPREDIWVAT